jgi:hypothetical protein
MLNYCDVDMRVDLTSEVARLSELRLRRDLPFRVLAAEIGLTEANLYRLLTRSVVANERTAFRIRGYLDGQKSRRATKRAKVTS